MSADRLLPAAVLDLLPVDALFLGPFATGLCFAVALPLLGSYLRLRDEWLAALAFAQTAAAGALLAMLAGLPLVAGGVGAAALAAGLKTLFDRATRGAQGAQGAYFALLLVFAWAASVLLAANLPLAERMAHALFDGQLYFADDTQLLTAGVCVLAALAALRLLSRRLLLAHFFPELLRASGHAAPRLAFDLLVAATLALATMSIGVMGAFALIFVPPLLAARRAGNWRRGLALAVGSGVGSFSVAFALALALDQPFGPLLGGLLVIVAVLALLVPQRHAVAAPPAG